MRYKPSYYNIRLDHKEWTLLFNGVSSGLIRLPKPIAEQLLPFLGPDRPRAAGTGLKQWEYPTFEVEELPIMFQQKFPEFLEGNYFVPEETDEQQSLEDRYNYLRETSPFHITITTTMDCNLGCYYCYEDKSKQYLSRQGCDIILDWIRQQAIEKQHERLYIDWYGGEPMLNQDAILYFSEKVIALCEELGIIYSSSMISNGTRWPENPGDFVKKIQLKHVQITLDGPEQAHNKRRRYVDRNENSGGSFQTILETIDRLIGNIRVYLRINVDPWVGRSALELLDTFKERNWLRPDANFYPLLASIGPMTEHCGFLGESVAVQEFQSEFDKMCHEFNDEVARYIGTDGMQHMHYYPKAVTINCAAVGKNSMIFGPDGKMYKCCLEVGDSHRAHDSISLAGTAEASSNANALPIIGNGSNGNPREFSPDRWDKYDPFSHERCSQCQFLPICMGGCPKSQMDGTEYYIKLESEYWEENIDRVIKSYFEAEYATN